MVLVHLLIDITLAQKGIIDQKGSFAPASHPNGLDLHPSAGAIVSGIFGGEFA